MPIMNKITDMIIKSSKIHQFLGILFAVFGLANLVVAIYQLFFNQSIHGWYREIYGNIACSSSYQIYMGLVAAIAFSKIRKSKDAANS